MKKVLLIEDSQEIARMIFDYFEDISSSELSPVIELDYADNAELGLKLLRENAFDIILLDLMLPRMDGLTLCNILRNEGNDTPILMLTALDSKEDLLKGFEHGADDYLPKPFDLDILYARMQALLRRARLTPSKKGKIQFGEISIDLALNTVHRQDRLLILNPTTFAILVLLVQKAPELVTQEEIAKMLWDTEKDFEEKEYKDVLRSHIYQLRNQLDKPFTFAMLKTVPKRGFRLECAE